MTEEAASTGWFVGVDPDDQDAARDAIVSGSADEPRAWPALAVDSGVVDSENAYYDWLQETTVAATRAAVRERERADDQQLVHAIRTVDDLASEVNELAERHAEWAGSLFEESGSGVDYAASIAGRDPTTPVEERVVSLAERVVDLADERAATREFIERQAPSVAPNLANLAGPVLAARLIELAGSLEALAKMPSGTVQVLGAEDALFAHLRGHAPSPKHGVIFTHEYVRGTRKADRGSAARALAGKLAIAARIDHYSGDLRPSLKAELDERMATIRARAEGEEGDE